MRRPRMFVAAGCVGPLAIALLGCGSDPLPGCDDPSNPAVVCPATLEVVCTGLFTDVDLSSAGSCGDSSSTDDRPTDGFSVGTTDVTFMADGQSCTTAVTVADETPPTITCPASVTVLFTDPGVSQVFGVSAEDNCSAEISFTVAADDLPSGPNTVEVIATDSSGNEARCTTSGEVFRAFTPQRFSIAHAELGASVTIGWEPSPGEDVTAYRVFRADTPDGPFAPVADVPAASLLYVDPAITSPAASYQVQAIAGQLEGGISEVKTARAIAAANYDLRDQSVPGIGFATTLYGVVRYPADLSAGPYPLVLMLHGNHGICRTSPTDPNDTCEISTDHECPNGFTTPNAEGLTYLAETLASQGFIAVTISGNAMNCRFDFITERAQLLAEHLRRWTTWGSAAGAAPFGTMFSGAIDLDNVGLFGHSRGAEAVSVVPSLLAADPIAGVRVASVYALAPTDFASTEVVDAPYLLSLPGCDGDVSDLQGIRIYDRSYELAGEKAQVMFIGANHNFFNTNWAGNDGLFACNSAALVGSLPQMRMLERSAGDWFRANLIADPLALDLSADADAPDSLDQASGRDLDLRWSYAAGGRLLVEDFTDGDAATNSLGLANTMTGFTAANLCSGGGCGNNYRHQRPGVRLSWDGGVPLFRAELGGADVGDTQSLAFRVVSNNSGLNTNIAEQSFVVRLIDGAGNSAELLLTDTQLVPHLYGGAGSPHEVLQTVRTPLDDFIAKNPALDLGNLAAIELEMTAPGHASGQIVLTDLEFHR